MNAKSEILLSPSTIPRALAISRYAKKEGVDMIVMGLKKRRSSLAKLYPGKNPTDSISADTGLPVIVVP